MLRFIIVFLLCFYSLSASAAGIDIVKACEERDEQKKVDSILDKISQSGYDSLSEEEKEELFNQK